MTTMTATISRPTRAITTRWLGLSVILSATIMNLLDATVVNVAGPSIQAELGGGRATLQWIAAGYTLALAAGLLTGGRLGDMFGRKRILMIGVAGFTLTSAVCALAWSPEILIAARVLQGLCAAAMVPQCFGLIRDVFGPMDIGRAFAAIGPAIGLATIVGPIVAGLLMQADFMGTGWRMIFFINLPLGAWALVTGNRVLPESRPTAGARTLDVAGVFLAGAGMFLMVYPLVMDMSPAWALVAVPVLAAFVRYQLRRKASGRVPLVELSIFSRRSYSFGVVFVIVFFGAIVGFSLAVALFLQLGLGYSPMKASLTMASWAIGAFIGSGFAAAMMAKLGRRIIHIGLSIMVAGLAGMFLGWLFLPLLVFGIGMGMIFVPMFDIVMGEIGDHEVGSASSSLEALQQLGASLGIAVLGTVFFEVAGQSITAQTAGDATGTVTAIALVLTAAAFGLGFLLPRKARAHAA